jgi:hypothetical protein
MTTAQFSACFELPNLTELVPSELEPLSHVFGLLRTYCDLRLGAARCRRDGDLNAAWRFDDAADRQYQKLTAWVRW